MNAPAQPLIDTARALVHRRSLVGFRAACEQMWGNDGCRALAEALPPQVRERTAGLLPLADWLPLGDLIAWHNAVWDGPVKRDKLLMKEHARVVIDQGFGRVKRFVLSMATPHALIPRVTAMWQEEYSTGTLTAESEGPDSVTLCLREHPYVDNPLMRFVIAEALRHVVSLTKVENVTETHSVRERSLLIAMRWD